MIISEFEKRLNDAQRGGKKNRVNLDDYDIDGDVTCRLCLAKLTTDELAILEEILYSPLSFPLIKLAASIDLSTDFVKDFVEKFAFTQLYTFDGTSLHVNKEKRKYFEVQIEKFEDDFTPDLDFLQSLLKLVPIHVLPTWYQIPRTSNNIFTSIVEKYLLTPSIYQRYLFEFISDDPVINALIDQLREYPTETLYVEQLQRKLGATEEEMAKALIFGEFNFLYCTAFERSNDTWREFVTPFVEWRNYLAFIHDKMPQSIEAPEKVQLKREKPYAFIEDMTTLLAACQKHDIPVFFDCEQETFVAEESGKTLVTTALKSDTEDSIEPSYIDHLINKSLTLGLSLVEEEFLRATSHAEEWMKIPLEKRAHITFKHPHNFLDVKKIAPSCNERSILEIQKSMAKVADKEWVYFEDYLHGCPIELSEEKRIFLKKEGRNWQYSLPQYNDNEKELIRYTVLEWFFESGVIQSGHHNGKECFKLTQLGRALFKS